MTLARYFALRFLVSLGSVLLVCVALIFLIESVENLRRASDHGAGIGVVVVLTLYRLPTLVEQVLPFATLFAAMTSFLVLSRNLELVVVRAAGVSVWQFIAPALVAALAVGVISTTVFNPLSAWLKGAHTSLYAASFTRTPTQGFGLPVDNEVWLRQESDEGQSVMHAAVGADGGQQLRQVTAFVFDESGTFTERVEADEAVIEDGRWRMSDVTIIRPGSPPERGGTYLLPTYLTPEQVRERVGAADTVGFWDLPEHVSIAERAGISPLPYELQYQTLLARPLLLCAMVLIAATVSLRLFRFGNVGQMILGGVVAGFVLYVVAKLTSDLAVAGALSPVVAAWGPAIIALLWGATLLLFREDG